MGTYVLKLDETQNRWIVASLHRKQDKKKQTNPNPEKYIQSKSGRFTSLN